MSASATLSATTVTVEPGQQASCPLVITNGGSVVDQFTVEVVGDVAGWTTAEPAVVNLMPGQSATVLLHFTPPRSAGVAARSVPFAVRVSAGNDPGGSVVEEGSVEVGAFTAVSLELSPESAEGSTKASYEVVVDNAGNHPVEVELHTADPENGLSFRLDRSRFALDAGTAAFIGLRVRPRRRFLRGQPRRHPFRVVAAHGRGEPLVADGVLVQRQLLPKWLIPVLIAVLLFGGLLAGLWLGVMRPAVKTAARSAAAEQVSEVKASAAQAGQEAGQARQEAATAKQNADQALDKLGIDPSGNPTAPSTPVPPPAPTFTPIDFRIATNAPITSDVRSFREFSFAPEDATKKLLITDLVLQNPRGNTGTIQILRDSNGKKTVLLEVGLANFRDLDEHWAQPWQFDPGERVVVAVSCQNQPAQGSCTPAVSFSGRLES